MADLDVRFPAPALAPPGAPPASDEGAAARAQLRRQIASLELRLAGIVAESLAYGPPRPPGVSGRRARPAPDRRGPRVLDLGELEQVRDDLVARVTAGAADLRGRAEHAARARLRLEEMRLHPGRHRFARVTCAELGEGGCGVWQVRPRLGLVGMVAGWWELTLSSGCPLPGSLRHPSTPD